ncbi:hypothetical protein Z042_07655 [Chania multitudinisentens RB-25]|uniref:DUF1120 domain-containing protein n=1 Tax=Chania multitudinisentens RB-25 TaxID=1441930 RepID=W0LB62_9GAMM|nr:DUF1120 domain-containing protein [Chania multitudinisentens]AHG19502.1 hypothetical protein Z042_07655 [Chania multitudinisentens RB-25]
MLNHIQKSACALTVVLATAALPALAESIDVRVIGTISPTACTPTLAGGGTIDYGTIKPTSLSADAYTLLDEKQVEFTITCDAPAKIAVQVVNQRVGSLAGSTNETSSGGTAPAGPNVFGSANMGAAGLGLDGTVKIGGYGIRLATGTMLADGVAVDSIQSNGNTTSWAKTEYGSLLNSTSTRYSSWATTGTATPVAFTTLSGQLGVQAYINKASELDLTKPIALDGLTTLELVYL